MLRVECERDNVLLLPLLLLFLPSALLAGSLQTRFTTVVLEDVPVGRPVALCLPDGGYYGVRNASERAVKVRFTAVVPEYCEPATGGVRYVAIPARDWVHVEPAVVTVPPNGEAETLVTVTVSNAPAHVGQRYEFWLRAEAAQGQAGVALLSRVRFNTVASDQLPPLPTQPPRRPNERLKPERRSLWRRLWGSR